MGFGIPICWRTRWHVAFPGLGAEKGRRELSRRKISASLHFSGMQIRMETETKSPWYPWQRKKTNRGIKKWIENGNFFLSIAPKNVEVRENKCLVLPWRKQEQLFCHLARAIQNNPRREKAKSFFYDDSREMNNNFVPLYRWQKQWEK